MLSEEKKSLIFEEKDAPPTQEESEIHEAVVQDGVPLLEQQPRSWTAKHALKFLGSTLAVAAVCCLLYGRIGQTGSATNFRTANPVATEKKVDWSNAGVDVANGGVIPSAAPTSSFAVQPSPYNLQLEAKSGATKTDKDNMFGPVYDFRDLDPVTAGQEAISALSRVYAFTQKKNTPWTAIDRRLKRSAEKALKTGDTAEYYMGLINVARDVHDGQFALVYDTQTASNAMETFLEGNMGGSFGFSVMMDDNGFAIVVYVDKESQAHALGVAPGMRVESRDDTDISSLLETWDWYKWAMPMGVSVNPATKTAQTAQGARFVTRGVIGSVAKFRLVEWDVMRADPLIVDEELIAYDDQKRCLYATAPKKGVCYPECDHAKTVVGHHVLPDGYGYLAIQGEALYEGYPNRDIWKQQVTDALNDFKNQGVDAIMIDLRGNKGGDDELAAWFSGALLSTAQLTPESYDDINGKTLYKRTAISNEYLMSVQAIKLGMDKFYNAEEGPKGFSEINNNEYGGGKTFDGVGPYYVEPKGLWPTNSKPVVCLVNSQTIGAGEGMARGCQLAGGEVVGWEGETTAASFGVGGAQIWMPGNIGFVFPFGRSLDDKHKIMIDSGAFGFGGIQPTKGIPRTVANVVKFGQGVGGVTAEDVERAYAYQVLTDKLKAPTWAYSAAQGTDNVQGHHGPQDDRWR